MTIPYCQARNKAVVFLGCKCFYCGKKAQAADHIVPSYLGGRDVEENLIAACTICNSTKKQWRLDPAVEKKALMQAFVMAPLVRECAAAMLFAYNAKHDGELVFAD
jgi:hypothetical protein